MAQKNTAKKNTARKKPPNQKSGGRFQLTLGVKGGVYLLLFVFLAMVWSFILGVFIGRGYNPEDYVPEIARVIPEKEHSPDKAAKSDTLRPEDLDFFERLTRDEPEPEKSEQRLEPEKQPEEVREQAMSISPREKKEFDYQYQVASFRDMDKANSLHAKLSKENVPSSITKAFAGSEPWFRVLVDFQGTESRAEEIQEKLNKLGIKEPLLKSKKPARE
ncbi:MAG: SPOR domain-containing protein [Desulfonatronovibrionaceae bacterium]